MNCVATARALDRDQMILDHLPQVEMIARSIHRRCPPSVLFEDLVSAGTLGLLDAMTRFDPNRHLKLKTLAEHRIRGAILDYLRRLDPLSRSVRQFKRRRVAVVAEFESRCGGTPSDEELARELGLSLPKFCRLALAARAGCVASLDSSCRGHLMPADDQREQVEASEAIDRLRTAIRELAGREAVVIDAVCEGRSAKAIAFQLSISPASVSLIKRQAVGRLRLILTGARGATR